MLDDNGIRPPLIAAGINLFGGPLGLIHRHVTGAIPIRRNTKDPAYLITLKAYVAEILKRHDLLLLPGRRAQLQRRAEAGEDRAASRGAGRRTRPTSSIMPMAIAYDLVLEDHILARQRVKKRQRPFARELAEMVRYAVGYRSRAFVTFGAPIPRRRSRPAVAQRRARADAARPRAHRRAVQGAADRRRSPPPCARRSRGAISRTRIDRLIEELAAAPRQPRRDERAAGGRRSRRAARDARHRRRSSADGSACANAACSATTRGRSSTCSSPPGRTH